MRSWHWFSHCLEQHIVVCDSVKVNADIDSRRKLRMHGFDTLNCHCARTKHWRIWSICRTFPMWKTQITAARIGYLPRKNRIRKSKTNMALIGFSFVNASLLGFWFVFGFHWFYLLVLQFTETWTKTTQTSAIHSFDNFFLELSLPSAHHGTCTEQSGNAYNYIWFFGYLVELHFDNFL